MMYILYLLSKEAGFILAAIGVIVAIVSLYKSKNSEMSDKEIRSNNFRVTIAVAVVLLLVANYFFMSDFCRVPNVIGMTSERAVAAIYEEGLIPQISIEESPNLAVVSIEPAVGAIVKKGTDVQINCSYPSGTETDQTHMQTEQNQETNDSYYKIVEECEILIKNQDFLSAIACVEREIAKYGEHAQYAELLALCQSKYVASVLNQAESHANAGKYRMAIATIMEAQENLDSAELMSMQKAYMTRFAALTSIAVGREHTVRLYENGRMAAVGRTVDGQCDVENWTNIKAIVAGDHHTVALRENGSVLADGKNDFGQCNVSGWQDIKLVAAGDYHTVGLTEDGTLFATGMNNEGQINVGALYRDAEIVSLAAGYFHTVALHVDGTVSAVGDNTYDQCNVNHWTDIVAIYAGTYHTLGLRSDGTVVATGNNQDGACNVEGWTDMDALSTGDYFSLGLRSDGTVAICGETSDGQQQVTAWKDVSVVAGGRYHVVGMKHDGSLIAVGGNPVGQCDVHLLNS